MNRLRTCGTERSDPFSHLVSPPLCGTKTVNTAASTNYAVPSSLTTGSLTSSFTWSGALQHGPEPPAQLTHLQPLPRQLLTASQHQPRGPPPALPPGLQVKYSQGVSGGSLRGDVLLGLLHAARLNRQRIAKRSRHPSTKEKIKHQ
jgi:hypothetical protein